jgi:hypothetical protein
MADGKTYQIAATRLTFDSFMSEVGAWFPRERVTFARLSRVRLNFDFI